MQPVTIASVRAHGVRQLLVYLASARRTGSCGFFSGSAIIAAMPRDGAIIISDLVGNLDMCQDLAKVL